MSNALAKLKPRAADAALLSGGGFLKRVKLCAPLTKEVQDEKATEGDFFYGQTRNLGKEVEVVIMESRPHALRLIDNATKVDAETFDMADPVFKAIQAEFAADWKCGSSWGPDYLFYIPGEKDFGVIFLNKMAKGSASEFEKNIGKLVVLKAEKRDSKKTKTKYKVPMVYPVGDGEVPDSIALTDEDVARALEMFRNAKARVSGAPEGEGAEGPAATKGGRKAAK